MKLFKKQYLKTIACKSISISFTKKQLLVILKVTEYSMATLPLGNLIFPLTKELSKQDRNAVHIDKGINTFHL